MFINSSVKPTGLDQLHKFFNNGKVSARVHTFACSLRRSVLSRTGLASSVCCCALQSLLNVTHCGTAFQPRRWGVDTWDKNMMDRDKRITGLPVLVPLAACTAAVCAHLHALAGSTNEQTSDLDYNSKTQ